jgi:hypothetical protein
MLLAQVVDPSQAKEWLTETNYTVTGVVLVILAALAFAVWRVARWVGKEFVLPVRDRLFIALDKLLVHLDLTGITFKEVSTSLQKLSTIPDRLDTIEGKVDVLSQRVDSMDTHSNRKNS